MTFNPSPESIARLFGPKGDPFADAVAASFAGLQKANCLGKGRVGIDGSIVCSEYAAANGPAPIGSNNFDYICKNHFDLDANDWIFGSPKRVVQKPTMIAVEGFPSLVEANSRIAKMTKTELADYVKRTRKGYQYNFDHCRKTRRVKVKKSLQIGGKNYTTAANAAKAWGEEVSRRKHTRKELMDLQHHHEDEWYDYMDGVQETARRRSLPIFKKFFA